MSEKFDKVILNLRKGDRDKLRDLFPDLQWSVVVRTIVSSFVDKLEGEAQIATHSRIEPVPGDIGFDIPAPGEVAEEPAEEPANENQQ